MHRRTLNIILRIVVAPVIVVAALIAIELLTFTAVSMAVSKPDWGDYRDLASGLAAVACCAAAVKFVFNVRLSYWVVLILVFIVIALLIVGIQAGVFLG
jgi:hypothetical protein